MDYLDLVENIVFKGYEEIMNKGDLINEKYKF